MLHEGRDGDVRSELEASRLDAPASFAPLAFDRSPRPGEAEDPDAPHRARGDSGERTGASETRSDAGSLSSESASASPAASAAIVELDGLVERTASGRAKDTPDDASPNARGTKEKKAGFSTASDDDDEHAPTRKAAPRPSFGPPRVSRQKSWGSAKIARLDEEARADSLRETKRRAAQRSLPLFSKLRYVLLCGDPLAAERMLNAKLRRMSAAAAPRRGDARAEERFSPFSFSWSLFSRARRKHRESGLRFHDEKHAAFDTHWWMIHPFSRFRRRWDVAVVVATAYVALLAPFVIGFDVDAPRGSALFLLDRCADAAFFLDVLLNYLTGFVETNRGRVVLEPRAVAWRYTRTWAPLDALASVPFDLVFPDEDETAASYGTHDSSRDDAGRSSDHDSYGDAYGDAYGEYEYSHAPYGAFAPPLPPGASVSGTSSPSDAAYRGAKVVRVIKLIRLLKLFRVLRVTRALARLERGLSVRYGAWQIVKFMCVVLTLAHWQACAWFLTHAVQKSAFAEKASDATTFHTHAEDVATWVDALAEAQGTAPETLDDASRFAKYAACVYWATTTMTTIGYGDIVPVNAVERAVVIVAQLIGSCVFLYGLTQVTALVADNDSGDVEFQRVLDDANTYFEKRSVPTSMRQKVREHLHHRRFFFASSSVGGGGGFEASVDDSAASEERAFESGGARCVPRARSGRRSHLDAFCADDDGERRVLSRLSLEVRREVRLWSMRDVLNQQPFFRDDPRETFVKLCTDSLRRRFFGPNERVVRAGDVGSELFFLSRGDAEVRTRRGRRVRALPEGAMFGEIALVLSMTQSSQRTSVRENGDGARSRSEKRKAPSAPVADGRGSAVRRTADVRTSAFVETLVLSDTAYRRAAAAAPGTAAEVERLARERFKSVNAARWRSATLAVLAANAIARNAGITSFIARREL